MVSNPVPPATCIRFGEDFELDLRAYELRSRGIPIKLKPNQMELLLLLIQRRGELVTRDHIVEQIWGKGVFLDTNNSINAAISKIRQALRDSIDQPRFVQTVPGKGYRFIAPIEEVRPPALGPAPVTDQTVGEGLLGKKVSHYRVLQLLGGGGMGLVYKAEDLKLGRQVALKFLPGELGSNQLAYERLQREARAASSLDHPNICSIYELGEHDGQPFIVMQLLEGRTLRDWIESQSSNLADRLQPSLDLAIQIADGLAAAHEKGVIHRDIKPANIFVTTRGDAKILDFGVAKFVESGELDPKIGSVPESGDNQSGIHLTRTDASVGTPSYLSPEQFLGEKLDARTDLFSFGLVLYEMTTGQRAFSGSTATAIRESILNQPLPSLRGLSPETPPELERIMDHCLEKDRDLRYQSARDCRDDLLRLQASLAEAERPLAPVSNKRSRLWAIVFTAMALASVLVYLFWHHRTVQASRLTENDSLVLADFANSTGDAVFDGSLKQGLRVALSQSPFLNIISDRKVRSTLKLMRRQPDAVLTPDVAQEVCQRAGSKAYVDGTIAALGSSYVIGLHAENCLNGEILAQEQVTAKSKEDVIPALGAASSHLRSALGESISSVQKVDVPLREATTSSLDALKEYTLGGQAEQEQGQAAAIDHYKRAIAIDPLFARAYSSLSGKYFDAGESALAAQAATKAYELRNRVSEFEQVQIESSYYSFTTGDLEKAISAYERWVQMRPRHASPHSSLAYIYAQTGQNEKALAEALDALRLGASGPQYVNVVSAYISLDRLKEAKASTAEAISQNMELPFNHNNAYLIAFLERDNAAMEREVNWSTGKPELDGIIGYSDACTKAYFGRMKESRGLMAQAIRSAIGDDLKEAAASYQADGAIHEALYGEFDQVTRQLRAVDVVNSGQDLQAAVAMAYAFAGQRAPAEALADKMAKAYPQNTLVQFNYLPVIRGQLALLANKPDQAIDLLKDARRYELGQPAQVISINVYPAYVRGQAYLALHDGSSASAEFQRILDHPGMSLNEPIAALAYLGLARAAAAQSDSAKAKSYQDFLQLWKDADTDLPVLKQAKSEYAKLQASH